jgi:hypothetical protein
MDCGMFTVSVDVNMSRSEEGVTHIYNSVRQIRELGHVVFKCRRTNGNRIEPGTPKVYDVTD